MPPQCSPLFLPVLRTAVKTTKTPAEIGSCILHRERIEIMLERLPITPHLITIDKPMMETYSHRHRTASLHIDHYLSEYRQRDILACILRKLEL